MEHSAISNMPKQYTRESLRTTPASLSKGTKSTSTITVRELPSSSITSDSSSPRSSRVSQWMTEWVTDWWVLELTCWLITTLSLIAIVAILEVYKNKPLPQWSFGITLNSVLSIFATIGQMTMMMPVVECIGQLKWLWFAERKEKLAVLQDFEDASRGPIGSALLVGKLRGFHLVSVGAAITVASIAFATFAQQVVTYPLRLHPVGTASTPQVFRYNGMDNGALFSGILILNYEILLGSHVVSAEITAAMYDGFASAYSSLSTITPSCSTGNCTWSNYTSLGICASISDLSPSVRNNSCDNITAYEEIFTLAGVENPGYPCFNYTLPQIVVQSDLGGLVTGVSNATLTNGNPITDGNPSLSSDPETTAFMEVMSLYPTFTNSSSMFTALLLYQPGFLASINSTLQDPIVYGLSLNPCIQIYNTTVKNGIVDTTVISSQDLDVDLQETFILNNNSYSYDGNDSYVSVNGSVFETSLQSLYALREAVRVPLISSCFFYILSPETPTWDQHYCYGFGAGAPLLDALVNSTDPLSAVRKRWDSLAVSITNALRTGAGGSVQNGQFQGTALAPIAFVETQYAWLSLPIGLVIITLVFLLATIFESRRFGSRIWKSSNLAIFQNGLHGGSGIHYNGLTKISEIQQKAKVVKVQLDMRTGSWK